MTSNTELECSEWIQYWDKDETWTDSELWVQNAYFFFKKVAHYISFSLNDSVLDIGCGPGIFAEILAPQVQHVTATDTSERYLRLCAARCEKFSNVITAKLPEVYTDIHTLGKFNLIICNSVIQYYKTRHEIEHLIESAQKAALPGGKLLISEIPVQRSALGKIGDAALAFSQCIQEGFALGYIKMASKLALKPSFYKEFSKTHDILLYDMDYLESLPKRFGLQGQLIRESLSLCTYRPSLLIQFK